MNRHKKEKLMIDWNDLFKVNLTTSTEVSNINIFRNVFGKSRSEEIFKELVVSDIWFQPSINFSGNLVPIPRLNSWYGDPNNSYTYSGIKLNPIPWSDIMMEVKLRVEIITGTKFNSALLNLYRDGNDSVSWHSDDEPELGEDPIIASLSLGSTRTFKLKNIKSGEVKKFELENDTILLMGSGIQKNWIHSVPKTKKPVDQRINITFRNIK